MLLAVKLTLITLAGVLVDVIGKQNIANFIHNAVSSVTPSPTQKRQSQLQKELLQAKADLKATSAQDQFAQWAKTRRRIDKLMAELEGTNRNLQGNKSSTQMIVLAAVFLLTYLLPFYYTSMHKTSAALWIPHGWFGPVDWFLGLPFAPAGAVSTGVWMMAVRRSAHFAVRATKDALASPNHHQQQAFAEPLDSQNAQTSASEKSASAKAQ